MHPGRGFAVSAMQSRSDLHPRRLHDATLLLMHRSLRQVARMRIHRLLRSGMLARRKKRQLVRSRAAAWRASFFPRIQRPREVPPRQQEWEQRTVHLAGVLALDHRQLWRLYLRTSMPSRACTRCGTFLPRLSEVFQFCTTRLESVVTFLRVRAT